LLNLPVDEEDVDCLLSMLSADAAGRVELAHLAMEAQLARRQLLDAVADGDGGDAGEGAGGGGGVEAAEADELACPGWLQKMMMLQLEAAERGDIPRGWQLTSHGSGHS
jgi:hypothetical protein